MIPPALLSDNIVPGGQCNYLLGGTLQNQRLYFAPPATSSSHGPVNRPLVSNCLSSRRISSQASIFSFSARPESIWCSAPKDSCINRTHSSADSILNGAVCRFTCTSLNPDLASRFSMTPGLARLNGPGCPGPGAGRLARRRTIDMGPEKNRLFSGTENRISPSLPPFFKTR